MTASLFTILGFTVFGVASFIGIFYLIRNGVKDDGYSFLYLLLLLFSFELFYKTLIHSHFIDDLIVLYTSKRFFNPLVYPLFLFFVYSITRDRFRLNSIHWSILILVGVLTVWYQAPVFGLSNAEKYSLLEAFYADTRPGAFNYWINWKTLFLGTVIPVVFVAASGFEFIRFHRRNRNITKRLLLYILMMVIVLLFVFNQFSNLLYRWLYGITNFSFIEWPVDITFLSLLISLLAVIALAVNSGITFLPASKYATSSLHPDNHAQFVEKARTALLEEKLYLQPEFTIRELAKYVGTNSSYLSQAINQHLGTSFKDFINAYRIAEAKKTTPGSQKFEFDN